MSDARPFKFFQRSYTAVSAARSSGPLVCAPRHGRIAKIVTFAIPKGGTAKSTVLASTAVSALECGVSVVILDTDPRGDLTGWHAARGHALPEVVAVDASRFSETIERLRLDSCCDLVLIDTAGTESILNDMAMRAADLVVVPFGLNIFDVRSALKAAEQHRRAEREFALVLTKCPPHRGRIENVRSALASIGEFAGVPFINRVAS